MATVEPLPAHQQQSSAETPEADVEAGATDSQPSAANQNIPNIVATVNISPTGSATITVPMQDHNDGRSIVESGLISDPDASVVALGIPIEDTGASKVIQRVVSLAALAATGGIVQFNINLLRGRYDQNTRYNSVWAAFSTLLIELSIPASGFLGALYHNRPLACCYCSCNLFIAVVSLSSFVRFMLRISELGDGTQNCNNEDDAEQREACLLWTDNTVEKWMFTFNIAFTTVMGCAAFVTGNMLFNRLKQERSTFARFHSPIVGELVQLTANIVSESTGDVPRGTDAAASSAEPGAVADDVSVTANVRTGEQRPSEPTVRRASSEVVSDPR